MRVTILTYGSRGDVQPYLALAVGLQKSGHTVTLAAPHRFEQLAAEYGVHFAPLAGDPEVISRVFNDAGSNVLRMVRGMSDYLFSIAPDVVRGARRAIQGADLLVHSFAFTTGGHSFAREMGIPDVSVQTFPMFAPTRAFPNVALSHLPPGWRSYFSHWISMQIFWHGGNLGYYQMRRRAPQDFPARVAWPFTPTRDRPITPLLFAYSPSVLPRPADWAAPHIHVTGYFFLDHVDFQPSQALSRFLASGEAPVCISFGSMIHREAQRVTRSALHALAHSGHRAIFLTGWGGWQPESPPENTLFIKPAPHDWLFPKCRVIIHHGGAGTTAAALRAGVPNIVVPHAADQPFWGRRVAALGAGPQPIPIHRLTADTLSAALAEAETTAIRNGAQAAGRMIRAEDGVGAAVNLIEQHAARFWQKS